MQKDSIPIKHIVLFSTVITLIMLGSLSPILILKHRQTDLFDKSQIITKKDSFNLIFEGKVDGSMVFSTYYKDSLLIIDGRTEWLSQNMYETELISLDKDHLNMKSVQLGGWFDTNEISYKYEWEGFHILSSIKDTKNGVETTSHKKHEARTDVFERSSMILTLIQALPLKEGYVFKQRSLMTLENEIVESKIEVLGSELVTVPAGSFNTYKVKFVTPSLTNVVYINKTPLRFPVKYESIGYPISFELIKSEKDHR